MHQKPGRWLSLSGEPGTRRRPRRVRLAGLLSAHTARLPVRAQLERAGSTGGSSGSSRCCALAARSSRGRGDAPPLRAPLGAAGVGNAQLEWRAIDEETVEVATRIGTTEAAVRLNSRSTPSGEPPSTTPRIALARHEKASVSTAKRCDPVNRIARPPAGLLPYLAPAVPSALEIRADDRGKLDVRARGVSSLCLLPGREIDVSVVRRSALGVAAAARR